MAKSKIKTSSKAKPLGKTGSRFTRKNAWNNGGTFKNTDLLWYAVGVGEMQKLALAEPNSWWFFAAMHGEYVDPDGHAYQIDPSRKPVYPDWQFIPSPPSIPIPKGTITPQSLIPDYYIKEIYWNQCQHQSWYFLPWHRGYLAALEAQLRQHIIDAGGPQDWALPYWNYFGGDGENFIPPAFTQSKIAGTNTRFDGQDNPLFVTARYGPDNQINGQIYVVIANDKKHRSPANENCQKDKSYAGDRIVPNYGGQRTLFNHGGSTSGDIESNPHNLVHINVGGYVDIKDSNGNIIGQEYGLMSDPGTAALDPVFYLHHANIDRMWAIWNQSKKTNPTDYTNPTDPIWLDGPRSVGDREFLMPNKPSDITTKWIYTSNDVTDLGSMNYTYEDLPATVSTTTAGALTQKSKKLTIAPKAAMAGEENMNDNEPELIGANDGIVKITNEGTKVTIRSNEAVKSNTAIQSKGFKSFAPASETKSTDRIYLLLENIQGRMDATTLTVKANGVTVGVAGLFGLRRASAPDGSHGGQGLSFSFDITDHIDEIFKDESIDVSHLKVEIETDHPIPHNENITIGKISLYRRGQQ